MTGDAAPTATGGWSVPTGFLGRGLKTALPPEIWSQLESTYVGAGIEENWDALFRTLALFRRVAVEVAAQLGYVYPYEMDQRVVAYAQEVKGVERAVSAWAGLTGWMGR